MGVIAEIGDRILSVIDKESEWMQEITDEVSEEIEDLNTGQLDHGIDSEGQEITPFYTPFTVRLKKAKGQEADFVTLEDTGAFRRSFTTEVFRDRFEINATDSKRQELVDKYTKEIFGLTEESQEALREIYKDYLEEKIRDYLL